MFTLEVLFTDLIQFFADLTKLTEYQFLMTLLYTSVIKESDSLL